MDFLAGKAPRSTIQAQARPEDQNHHRKLFVSRVRFSPGLNLRASIAGCWNLIGEKRPFLPRLGMLNIEPIILATSCPERNAQMAQLRRQKDSKRQLQDDPPITNRPSSTI